MREIVLSHKIERDEFLRGKYVPREGLQLVVLTWDYMLNETYGDARIAFLPLWKWLIDHQ